MISFSECAVTITKPFGVITSPGFPQFYRNGIDCTWNIQLSIGQLIQFNFLHFDVEYVSSCWWDTSVSDIHYNLVNSYILISITESFWFQGWLIDNLWRWFNYITYAVLFNYCYKWQNVCLRLKWNRLYAVIHKMQKSKTKVLPCVTVGE